MDKLKSSFFQAYFRMPVPRIIVRTDAPYYTVMDVNRSYQKVTNTTADSISGRSLFQLFDLEKMKGQENELLKNALVQATTITEPIYIPEFELSSTDDISMIPKWWSIELLPVAEENERPGYLIITTRDITQDVVMKEKLNEAKRREQLLNEQLAATVEELMASNEELNATVEQLRQSQQNLLELNNELENRVLERTSDLVVVQEELIEQYAMLKTIVNEVPAGICVLKGTELTMQVANKKLQQFIKRDHNIIGKPLIEIMPEIEQQTFLQILEEVYKTGIPYGSFDAAVEIVKDGAKETVYRDYSYTPIKGSDGMTNSILAMSIDVTERTLARLREQELLEEQFSINEELSAANEELASANEELYNSQRTQQKLNASLAASESRFRNLIMVAPVAICLLNGSDHVLETINIEGLKLLGKKADVIGKKLKEIMPELENQPFIELLDGVYASGETYYGSEVLANFTKHGKMMDGYFNFIYKPLKDDEDKVYGIMIVATDVTDLITARKDRENAEAKLGLAIEAAQLGSWHIEPETKALHYNATLAKIFGYEDAVPMTYDQAIGQVTDDCREKLVEAIEKAIAEGGYYDLTYTQRRFNDSEIIWLRSSGRIIQNEQGEYNLFSGVVMDVTEQKQDEQRKNDFIGMVSHELKTPLTSMKGYAQILHSRANKNEDAFSINALTKVNGQVKKMISMINGFLNISRLEAGKIHLNKQNFYLDELVKENIDESEILITTHEIVFTPCEPVLVFADRDKIGSVISNLISNAVKYSPEGKKIGVYCKIIDSTVEIRVTDQGIGIATHDLDKLFKRFYRVESNQTQLISGFGIGLYLCAEIIERHDGKIWVESEPGHGSTFFFSLPII